MNDRARFLFGLGIVATLVAIGSYAYARYDMESRIRSYGGAIDDIGYGRGGVIPDQAQFEAQARSAAEDLGLELERFEVIRHEESGRDGVGNILQDRLGDAANVRMELIRYEVRASVVARKWIFSRRGELSVDRTFRREVHLDVPTPPPPPPPSADPPAPRGL